MDTAASSKRARPVALAWQELNKQRLGWALRAYDRFVDTLSDEVRERFARGDANREAYVAVFGKTQVGKTTLLLDLMGLTPDAMPRVSKVLRGNRGTGRSATATAMEYRRSPDSQWHLGSGPNFRIVRGDELMTQELADIRRQMSERKLHGDTPVTVWIPNECFSASESTATQVRILDLPGDNPADEVERKHVQDMARRYIPHADLILLVGRIDDLGFLRPDALALPSIEDWQIVPERFRIVTTYSFTANSQRELASQNRGRLDAAFFQEQLLQQIGTFKELELSEDARQLHRYFPLEFGDSWLDASDNLSGLKEQLDPIIAELKKKLLADIYKSATETSRLRNAVYVHLVVQRVKEAWLRKMNEELERLKQSCALVKRHRDTAEDNKQRACAEAQKKRDFLRSVQEQIEQIRQDVQQMGEIDIKERLDDVGTLPASVKAIQNRIVEFSSDLKNSFLNLRPPTEERKSLTAVEKSQSMPPRFSVLINLFGRQNKSSTELQSTETDDVQEPEESPVKKQFWRLARPHPAHQDVEKRISREFSGLEKELKDYWVDWYFSDDNFKNDKCKLRRDMQDAAKAVGLLAVEVWAPLVEKRLAEVEKESVLANDSAVSRKWELEQTGAELKKAQADIEKHEGIRSVFYRKMDADKERGLTFIQFLNEEYMEELKHRKRTLVEPPNSALSFIKLLSAFRLIEARSEIMVNVQ